MAEDRINKNDLITQEAIDAFATLSKNIIEAEESLISIAEKGGKLKKDIGGSKSFAELNKSLEEMSQNMVNLLKVQNDLVADNNKLKKSVADLTKEKKKNTQATKENAKESSKASKQATKDDSEQQKSKKGLGNAFDYVKKKVVSYIASYIALRVIVRYLFTDLLELIKKLDALNYSMSTVIQTNGEKVRTLYELSKMSYYYGQNILVLTERYVKFRAASQQANLSSKETLKIFNSTAKASAVLALTADEVNGVFLALEQMLSKGKVTTEELRRQLGERLPGAFGIMADAMGVPLQQLDKMLRAGEILSHEALPKFADALEEAYGIESVRKIDTLVAAHERLKVSWINFQNYIASGDAYQNALNNWSDGLVRLQMLLSQALTKNVDTSQWFDLYVRLSTRAGDATRDMADALMELPFEEVEANLDKHKAEWVQYLVDQGVTAKNAFRIWNSFIDKMSQMSDGTEGFEFTSSKSIEDLKKELRDAETEYTLFYAAQNDTVRESMAINAAFYSEDQTTYKEYLQNKLALLLENKSEEIDSLNEAKKAYEDYAKIVPTLTKEQLSEMSKEEKKYYRNQKKELDVLLQNWKYYADAYGEVSRVLAGLDKPGKKGKDETLILLKSRQALELAELKRHHAQLVLEKDYQGEELLQQQYDHDKEVLIQMLEDLEEQRVAIGAKQKRELEDMSLSEIERENIRRGTNNELLQIDTEYENLQRQLVENITEWRKRKAEEASKSEISGRERTYEIELELQRKLLALQEEYSRKSNLFTTPEERDEGEFFLEVGSIYATIDALEQMLEIEDLTANEIIRIERQIFNAKKQLQEAERDEVERTHRLRREKQRESLALAREYVQTSIDIISGFQSAHMEQLEWDYDREVALAGESLAMKFAAENEYNEKKRKLQRRQAVVDRAGAAFNIIISTLQGVASALASVVTIPLVPWIKGLGMLQLAALFATPLPKYEKGGKHKGGPAVFSEKGPELFITELGKIYLTPHKETIGNMPAGEFIPHDETQKILAGAAMNNFVNEVVDIDMGITNNLLRKMADKNEIIYQNGYKITNKNNIFGKYVTRH